MKTLCFLLASYIGLLIVEPLMGITVRQVETEEMVCTPEGCCKKEPGEDKPCKPETCCCFCNPFQVCGYCCIGRISETTFTFQAVVWDKLKYPPHVEVAVSAYEGTAFHPPEMV